VPSSHRLSSDATRLTSGHLGVGADDLAPIPQPVQSAISPPIVRAYLAADLDWGGDRRLQALGRSVGLLPRLDQVINLKHPLVLLAEKIDWQFLARRFGTVCTPGAGQPPLPTRLVAGLFILKHMENLSDEVLCERWVENPYYQFFCGELSFRHQAPFDRSSMTRWRQRLGEEQLDATPKKPVSSLASGIPSVQLPLSL
jgi:hypothetical protein